MLNHLRSTFYFNNVKFSYLAGYKNDFLDQRTNKRYGTKTHYSKNKEKQPKYNVTQKIKENAISANDYRAKNGKRTM